MYGEEEHGLVIQFSRHHAEKIAMQVAEQEAWGGESIPA
jgi:hypothetical protein